MRYSVMDKVGMVAGIATVLFAIVVGGVVEPLFLAHRETATCNVTHVSGAEISSRGGQTYWDVTTSCGDYSIDTATLALNVHEGAQLAASFETTPGHNTYVLEFQGWGVGRGIVGARRAS